MKLQKKNEKEGDCFSALNHCTNIFIREEAVKPLDQDD
jgi:hypothetical protein